MTQLKNVVFIIGVCLLTWAGSLRAQDWESVDDTTLTERERIRRSDYEVSIRSGRGEWRPTRVVGALVSNMDRRGQDGDRGPNGTDTLGRVRTQMSVAMFTDGFNAKGSNRVEVEVKRQGTPFHEVQIRPTAYRIKPKRVDERTVRFRLYPWQKVSVEFDGDRNHNLFVFPDLPVEKPAESDGLIYYGPGEHEVGLITLHSGQTLFLDEGAIVYGRIEAREAEHIRIKGRGILCGSGSVHDFTRRKSLIYMRHCRDIEVEGIFFRGSPSWTLCFSECNQLRMENIKQVCWMRNSDGIDLLNSHHVQIHNSFLRNYDDNISLKNFHSSTGQTTSDITMTNCTLWADCAHNLLVGPETKSELAMDSVLFENIQILEARETTWPWRGAMAVMGSDEGTFRHITFRNICLDHTRGGQMFAVEICPYNTAGRHIEDVRFQHIRFLGDANQLPLSTIKGLNGERRVDGVTLQHVSVNHESITQKNFSRFVETNEYATDVVVKAK